MTKDVRITGRSEKIKAVIIMGSMSLLCFGLSLFRFYLTGNTMFLFLNWNLFLASIPWAINLLWSFPATKPNKLISFAILIFSWLLFFPNSPYILTDLIHLKQRGNFPIWYDLILILTFAWTGLSYGFYSLIEIENILRRKISSTSTQILTALLLFIGAFGVYIGRFLRWNSWDIISNPLELLYDISERIINPFSHPTTWGITILLGIFLNLVYLNFRDGHLPNHIKERLN